MPLDDTNVYRRSLPHLSKRDKVYHVTFRTHGRLILHPVARGIVLSTCIHDHQRVCWLFCVVVMPDHVHLLLDVYETSTLVKVLHGIKGVSAHRINTSLKRHGKVWQHESFDHILRSDEGIRKTAEYIAQNAVRAGIVERWQDYPWYWRSC